MITVPPAAQATLAAYTDAQLKAALTTALRDVAFGLWEAKRRGYAIQASYEPPAPANDDQAREIQVTALKTVNL